MIMGKIWYSHMI